MLERQANLVGSNILCLRQMSELLERISDAAYVTAPAALPDQRAGAHLRHVLEFYECFFAGLGLRNIDYDARKRDLTLERNRDAALARIEQLIATFEHEGNLRMDLALRIRAEGSTGVTSSVGRELQMLASHAVHHFALIGFILRLLGVEVSPSFGVAPSTLMFRAAEAA